MPKKKNELSQAEQSKRFRDAVRELVDAGELSPTEADERFERAIRLSIKHSPGKRESGD